MLTGFHRPPSTQTRWASASRPSRNRTLTLPRGCDEPSYFQSIHAEGREKWPLL